MPPIKIHSQSPISDMATKPSGVTPQTEPAHAGDAIPAPAANQTSQSGHSYPPARPGAAPPAPTGASQPQRYAPSTVQPTPTQALANDGPPLPQPGAIPRPDGVSSTLPPPPKAGEHFVGPVPTATPGSQPTSAQYPSQMGMAPPTMPFTAQRGTSTAAFASGGSSFVPAAPQFSPAELGHPPGYQQNVNAGELNSHQRAAHFANVAAQNRERGDITSSSGTEEGVWDTAMKFAKSAGEKLSAAEGEVWKRINKEQ